MDMEKGGFIAHHCAIRNISLPAQPAPFINPLSFTANLVIIACNIMQYCAIDN